MLKAVGKSHTSLIFTVLNLFYKYPPIYVGFSDTAFTTTKEVADDRIDRHREARGAAKEENGIAAARGIAS